MLLEIGDQRVAIGGARSIGAERVEFQRHVLGEAELLPQACREQDHFGIDIWPFKAKGFHADLMELAVTAFLWALVTEHRSLVPEPLGLVMQQSVLHGGAYAAGSAFRAQGQAVAVAILKGVHLLLDNVGDLADGAREQRGLLDDGRADLGIAIAPC